MSGLEITVLTLTGIGVLLFFLRRRVAQFQKSYYEVAREDMLRAYRDVSRQKRREALDSDLAVARFNARAQRTIDHYVNQVYGGPENIPWNEYQCLNRRLAELQNKLREEAGSVLPMVRA